VEQPVAVILAAGVGRRLAPLTDERPKALVQLAGITLLERCLRALAAAGFARAVVVTGHREALVREFVEAGTWGVEVACVFNERYETTNNIVSFLVAADEMAGGVCLLNSDTVFDPTILFDVAATGDGSWLVVDHDEPLGAEEMKVEVDGAGVVRRVSKLLDPARSAGEYIGIARFDAHGAAAVLGAARTLVNAGRTDVYYEDAIDHVLTELDVRTVATRLRPWTEIDDHRDYARAVEVARAIDAAPAA